MLFFCYSQGVTFTSAMEPPLTIPNRVVKRSYADDTRMQIQGKVGQK